MYGIKSCKPWKHDFQKIIEKVHRRITNVKISPRLLFHILPLVKIFSQKHGIVQVDIWHSCVVHISYIGLQCKHINGFSIFEKIRRLHWF